MALDHLREVMVSGTGSAGDGEESSSESGSMGFDRNDVIDPDGNLDD